MLRSFLAVLLSLAFLLSAGWAAAHDHAHEPGHADEAVHVDCHMCRVAFQPRIAPVITATFQDVLSIWWHAEPASIEQEPDGRVLFRTVPKTSPPHA